MSAEQLARKRAKDREGQRLFRQRTKDYISDLEQQIRSLSGNRDSDKLLAEEQLKNKQLREEVGLLRQQLKGSQDGTSSPKLPHSMLYTRYTFDYILQKSVL